MLNRLALVLALLALAPRALPRTPVDEPFHDLTYEEAVARAEKEEKLVLIDFFTTWCGPCKQLDKTTWKDVRVRAWLAERTVALKLDAEKEVELAARFAVRRYPTILLLRPDGEIVDRIVGYRDATRFLADVTAALEGRDSLERSREAVEASPQDPAVRMKHARVLVQRGEHAAALKELEWCWDHGLEHAPSSVGVRLSFWLSDWARLAAIYPPARDSLLDRRTAAAEALIAGENASRAAQEVARIDERLEQTDRTIALFDSLAERGAEGQAARGHLSRYVFEALVDARRYADAVAALDSVDARMNALLARGAAREGLVDERAVAALTRVAVKEGALYVEALVGVDEPEDAEQVARQILALDASRATYKELAKRARRGGGEDLARELEKEIEEKREGEDEKVEGTVVVTPPTPGVRVSPSRGRRTLTPVTSDQLELDRLEIDWSRPGPFVAVAVDERQDHAYAVRRPGWCEVFDRTGEPVRRFPVPNGITILRSGRFASPLAADHARRGPDLLGFSTWARAVHAFTAEGVPLWIAGSEDALDDAWPGDLDGDGLDEVLLGYNGSGGLHLLGPDGAPQWEDHRFGNVWHVCTGDLDGDGTLEVAATSSEGKVHVHDRAGVLVGTFSTRVHAHFVRVVPAAGAGEPATLLVAGRRGKSASLVVLTGTGEELWHLELPPELVQLTSLAVHPDLPLAALSANERTLIVDLRRRETVAEIRGGARLGQVAWLPAGNAEPPTLLVTTGADLAALRLQP